MILAATHNPPRRLSPVLNLSLVSAAIALAFLAATPLLSDYGLQIGFRLLISLVLAEAWNLLAGYTGLVSLGSAAIVGVGGYTLVGIMNKAGFSLPLSVIAAGCAGALVALVASPAVFRMRGLYFTVGTLALGEAARMFMVNVPWFGGATGLFLDGDGSSAQGLYLAACLLFALTTLVMTAATGTRISVILRAIRDDEDAAAQFGVRPFRVKLAAFAAASFLMAMAGALQAYKLGAVEPYGMFGLSWSVDTLSIVIIGGLGLRHGPLVGAVFVIALAEALADYPELHIAITGVILIVIIRFAPKGLCGLAQSWIESRKARAAGAKGGLS